MNGPIWVDPNALRIPGYWPPKERDYEVIRSRFRRLADSPGVAPPPPFVEPAVSEERIREIVREEISQLPIRYDVPDAPPAA